MWFGVTVGIVALFIFIFKYALGSSGPNPFEKDTREPLKKQVFDKKEKNKVLKQGELTGADRGGHNVNDVNFTHIGAHLCHGHNVECERVAACF